MTKRRLLRWSLILVILAAFAVWLEPTRVGWGWLRGEAFYQGRPTSWWSRELGYWRLYPMYGWVRRTAYVDIYISRYQTLPISSVSESPPVLRDDVAIPVLKELLSDPSLRVRREAQTALNNLANRQTGQ